MAHRTTSIYTKGILNVHKAIARIAMLFTGLSYVPEVDFCLPSLATAANVSSFSTSLSSSDDEPNSEFFRISSSRSTSCLKSSRSSSSSSLASLESPSSLEDGDDTADNVFELSSLVSWLYLLSSVEGASDFPSRSCPWRYGSGETGDGRRLVCSAQISRTRIY
jgi:hypothetical protein